MSDNPRITQAKVDEMFIDRWSPRAFSDEPVEQWQIDSLLEAARWAPSCYNEQPWQFAYATAEEDRKLFLQALVKQNQQWAAKAPMLMFLVASLKFKTDGGDNDFAVFDAGSAWMSLAFQARKLGLYTHCMAGYSKKKAAEILGLDTESFVVAAAIAVGKIGDKNALPEHLVSSEQPNERKDLSLMVWNWKNG